MKIEDLTMNQLLSMVRRYNKDLKIVRYSKLSKPELVELLKEHPKLSIAESDDSVKFRIKGYSVENKPVVEITKETKGVSSAQRKKLTKTQEKQLISQARANLRKGVGNPESKPAPKKESKPEPKPKPKPDEDKPNDELELIADNMNKTIKLKKKTKKTKN
jgi:hypothetical protein